MSSNIKAVILAAGSSSRLYPFGNGIHKSMIKICGKPILEHTINKLKIAGIKNIIIVVDKTETVKSYFGDGKRYGVSIKYVVQENPLGGGNGVLLAKKYISNDFLLLNAYHADVSEFITPLLSAKKRNVEMVLLAKKSDITWSKGVLKVKNGRLAEIIEKPQKGKEQSSLCVVGIYLFPKNFLETLAATPLEHYQLESAISSYAISHYIKVIETEKETVTLKYPWDLVSMKNYLLKNIKSKTGANVRIAKSAEILGNVVIEDGATIMEGVRLKGPCYIGKDVVIGNNALLRNGADVEENCVIGAYMEVKNSLLMQGTTTHSGFIGDSVIGQNCRIAAQFCTANVRLDKGVVRATVKGEELNTGYKYLGTMIGENTQVGIKSSTMPGIIIGRSTTIGPSTVVLHNVEDGVKYYTKFSEVVTKK